MKNCKCPSCKCVASPGRDKCIWCRVSCCFGKHRTHPSIIDYCSDPEWDRMQWQQ